MDNINAGYWKTEKKVIAVLGIGLIILLINILTKLTLYNMGSSHAIIP